MFASEYGPQGRQQSFVKAEVGKLLTFMFGFSEKQKDYARKWNKENMHTISTRVRMEEFKDYKAWREMRGVSVTSEIKRFVMEELQKYYAELDRIHEEEQKTHTVK